MSLIRQIWSLLLGTVFIAFVGSFFVWMASSRIYLETQLAVKNSDNAQALALTLSQQHGDPALMELAVAAQFDTGYYRSIRLTGANGKLLIDRSAPEDTAGRYVPAWFVRLTPIASAPGVAQVSDGWRSLGTLEVVSHSSFAHIQLWKGSLQTGMLLLIVGVIAGGLGTWGVRRLQRPLQATAEQAQALMERRFITVKEPKVPELARLTRAMNAVVERLRAVFDEQATQVEALRVQAYCDPLTGLSHRRHFLSQFGAELTRHEGSGNGVLLLARVMHLAELNRDLGHARTDRLLQTMGQTLTTVLKAGGGEAIGRLNGSDFSLSLPPGGSLRDQAEDVAQRLRQACSGVAGEAAIVVAGVSWQRGVKVHEVLSAADEALARAESRGAYSVEVFEGEVGQRALLGEDEWRRRISMAVAERRGQLARLPVASRDGQLIHHESPLSLQIDLQNGFDAAAHWMPLALRTGLMPAVDELAVGLALEQIASDGLPRCIDLSPASLADSGYVPSLRSQLTASPRAATKLWLAVAESAAVERFELVRELCKQLRPFGVQVGLDHAGERLARIGNLVELGLDFIKLDAAVTEGVSTDAARAAHIRGIASMAHGLGLKVYAEDVASPDDAKALWGCGLDGIRTA